MIFFSTFLKILILKGGGPTLLGRPAGFSIRKALGESEIKLYKNNYSSYANNFNL